MEKIVVKWKLSVVFFSVIIASIADTTANTLPISKTIKEKPIYVNTVAQHYENPTIGQYQLCTKSRDACIEKCSTLDAVCRAKCPVCPVLIDQDILVQGINDTLYRLPISTGKVNQTNIIRLTNEIRNIIETNLGNITANNQNNINIYQNKTSRTGGRFGLGYNENGPCCHVVEPQRCKRSITGPNCSHRRKRTCGSHCISRVMRAKRVVSCSEANPDDCTQAVEYLPQPKRPGCEYTSKWPFINCRTVQHHGVSRRRSICARCYEISYVHVMRGQVPRACLPCYGRTDSTHHSPMYSSIYQPSPIYYGGYGQYPMYQSYQPYFPPSYYNYNSGNDWNIEDEVDHDMEMLSSGDGWKVEERKCINEDGTVAENCQAERKIDDYVSEIPDDSNYDEDYDTSHGLDYDYGEDETNFRNDGQRRRRQRRNKF